MFLELGRDAHFLGEKDKPSSLFIRKCYRDLKEIVLSKKFKRLRITGNLGIGKTFLCYFLLYVFAQSNQTVVYHEVNRRPILFSGENVIVASDLFEFYNYLKDENVWYIVVDGHHPERYDCMTILICSPQKEHYVNFDKWRINQNGLCLCEILKKLRHVGRSSLVILRQKRLKNYISSGGNPSVRLAIC
jgi:hypothetical protein